LITEIKRTFFAVFLVLHLTKLSCLHCFGMVLKVSVPVSLLDLSTYLMSKFTGRMHV